MIRTPHITVNTREFMLPHVHGIHQKRGLVCHETVSHDIGGLADGNSVAAYLAAKDYGIHGVIDKEGNLWWAKGLGKAIFYHATSEGSLNQEHALTNTLFQGVELVSYPTGSVTFMRAQWRQREKQLLMLARVIEWQSRVQGYPLQVSNGIIPGVTTHWQITKTFGVYGGHVDCYPGIEGGYFPLYRVVQQARAIRAARLGL